MIPEQYELFIPSQTPSSPHLRAVQATVNININIITHLVLHCKHAG